MKSATSAPMLDCGHLSHNPFCDASGIIVPVGVEVCSDCFFQRKNEKMPLLFERTTFPSITLYSINGRYYPTDASRKANAIADAFVESFADLTAKEQAQRADTIPCFNCTLDDGHADMGGES